ncbi:MAG: DUF4127 family protein [Spirochaetota bacterium]
MAAPVPRICYIPLDERPCNALFPGLHLGHAVELAVPPMSLLGAKKSPGNVDALAAWLEQELPSCDACVASVEQLMYGGLVPSRLHTEVPEELEARLARLGAVFKRNAHVNINLFALIMRTPSYSSSEEEPDYYEHYGEAIYKRSVLRDRRDLGYEIDSCELGRLDGEIPDSVIADYEHRRDVNRSILERVLELYAEGTVHYVAIPMDDSSRYGYTAADRRYVQRRIAELGLDGRVPVYPGADETGMTLLARAAVDHAGRAPSVFPLYRCEQARHHYPKYEGLELETTVTQHIRAAGCKTAESIDACDFVLAIHSGPRIEQDAGEQPASVGREAGRGRREAGGDGGEPGREQPGGDDFASRIAGLVGGGTRVAVADIAYANGGDIRFVRALDGGGALASLMAYGGWNTPGNTLGCVIATGVAQHLRANESSRVHGLLYRLFDDICYQVSVRRDLADETRQQAARTTEDGAGNDPAAPAAFSPERIAGMINASWDRLGLRSFRQTAPEVAVAELPWNRLFEVGFRLSVKEYVAGFSG